jgi:hypothetical protein
MRLGAAVEEIENEVRPGARLRSREDPERK